MAVNLGDTPTYPTQASANQATVTQGQTTLTDSTGGSVSTTLAAISNNLSGGVGLSSPTATAVNTELGTVRNAVASLAAEFALVKTDVANMITLLHSLRTALVNAQIIKGDA